MQNIPLLLFMHAQWCSHLNPHIRPLKITYYKITFACHINKVFNSITAYIFVFGGSQKLGIDLLFFPLSLMSLLMSPVKGLGLCVLVVPSANQCIMMSLSCGCRVISHMAFMGQVIGSNCVQSAREQKHKFLLTHFPFHPILFFWLHFLVTSIPRDIFLGQTL